jgi:hypothetical protein
MKLKNLLVVPLIIILVSCSNDNIDDGISKDSESNLQIFPEVTLIGDSKIVLLMDNPFNDPGVKYSHDKDDFNDLSLFVEGAVDVSKEGLYSISYQVSDSNGNLTSVTREVQVISKKTIVDKTSFYLTVDSTNSYQLYFDNQNNLFFSRLGKNGFLFPIELNFNSLIGKSLTEAIEYLYEYESNNDGLENTKMAIGLVGFNFNLIQIDNEVSSFNDNENILLFTSVINDRTSITNLINDDKVHDGLLLLIDELVTWSNTNYSNGELISLNALQLLELRDSEGIDKLKNDVEPPNIELQGPEVITLFRGAEYYEFGVLSSDNLTTNPAIIIDSKLDTNVTGEYFINYQAKDKAGNLSPILFRRVNVIDYNNVITRAISFINRDVDFNQTNNFYLSFPTNTLGLNETPKLYLELIFPLSTTREESYYCFNNVQENEEHFSYEIVDLYFLEANSDTLLALYWGGFFGKGYVTIYDVGSYPTTQYNAGDVIVLSIEQEVRLTRTYQKTYILELRPKKLGSNFFEYSFDISNGNCGEYMSRSILDNDEFESYLTQPGFGQNPRYPGSRLSRKIVQD